MFDNPLLITGIGLCFFLAGIVKGVIGMGLPTIAMGLLGLAMPSAEAAALLILPSAVTNIWQMVAGPKIGSIGRRLLTMQIGVFLGTFLGIRFLTGTASSLGNLVLGIVLAAYAVMGLFAVRFMVRPSSEVWLSPIIGVVTGVLSGATGVFVVPAVPYLSSLGLDKESLIQALGLSFTVSTLALGLALAQNGIFSGQAALASTLALVPALGGMFLGQSIRYMLQPETFRRWFFISLLLIGLYMVIRSQ